MSSGTLTLDPVVGPLPPPVGWFAAYPGAADLAALLEDADLPTGGDLDGAIRAGIQDFERRCHRKMLAESSRARAFDPPTDFGALTTGGTLLFDADLAYFVELAYAPFSGTSQASSVEKLTRNIDFWLMPQNAAEDNQPYRWIDFRRPFYGPTLPANKNSLVVTGWWGYGLGLPPDARSAMLYRAAVMMHPQKMLQISGAMQETGETGEVRETYGPDPGSGPRNSWDAVYAGIVRHYQRRTIV